MRLIVTTILLLNFLLALGQGNSVPQLLSTNSKAHFYYVNMNDAIAYVYQMGGYLDKAGTGFSIQSTDTLNRNPDGTYSGNKTKISLEENKLYIIVEQKKTRKFLLDSVKNSSVANYNLNNGYYLDHYFKMTDELNELYPLNHHSFRNAFGSWKEVPNQNLDYLLFRDFADQRLKEIKDSISIRQEEYTKLTNYIIQNLSKIDYNTLKDSLTKLPADYKYLSWYYGTVIGEVAKQQPEYFFKLAEDFPANQDLIFFAAEANKDAYPGLKAVSGHDEVKKSFFKRK